MQKKRKGYLNKLAQSGSYSWLIWLALGIVLGIILLMGIAKVLKNATP